MAWDYSFFVSGEGFRPSLVDFAFTDQEDTGCISKSGRLKGKPIPVGSASYRVPRDIPYDRRLQHIADIFQPMLPKLREVGATDWQVWIARYYHAQCNEEFSPEELRHLLRLDCGLCYSAYSVSESEEAAKRKEFGYQ